MQESSESKESPDEQHPQAEEESEEETYEAHASSKQDYHLKKNMAIALSVERQDTLPRIVQRGRKRLLRRI